MSTAETSNAASTVSAATDRAADTPWIDRALRAGLAARGFVFLIFAYLVARIALGALGQPSTSTPAGLPGVPQALAAVPGGRPLLFVLAAGLALYALFSLVDAIRHHNHETPAAKKWADRALSILGTVMYGVLCVYSIVVAVSGGSTSAAKERNRNASWSASVLRWPGGPFWLGLLAAILIGITVFLISRAARRSFQPRLERDIMSDRMWRIAMVLGAVGYLGRAALFGIVGGCIMTAAVENDPEKGQGVDGSIRILAASTAGQVLLWALTVMLVTYGLYMFVETRYRRV